MILKSQKNIRWNYAPWGTTCNIVVEGTVPAAQDYCAETDTFTPDYTLTYLVLQPVVGVICTDNSAPKGNANALLGNIRWYEIIDRTERLITSANTGYDISGCAEGLSTSGQIKVKKNVQPSHPVTLKFKATLTDTKTGATYDIEKTFCVKSQAVGTTPVLTLDCCRVVSYNPLRDAAIQPITATLKLGKADCATANRLFVWEAYREGTKQWTEIGADPLDYWATVSADTSVLTLNRELMDTGQRIRCRAKVCADGNPSAVALTEGSPQYEFRAERVMRNLTLYDNTELTIPDGTAGVAATAVLSDGRGRVPAATVDKHFSVKWKTVANSAALNNPTFADAAYGCEAIVPTSKMNDRYGMQVMCEVEDRGPLRAWADGDGDFIADGNGDLIVIK